MIAVIQRARDSWVEVDDRVTGKIDHGLVILLGILEGDSERDARFLAAKITGLRIFNDPAGKMNLSILDVEGAVLVISQFTLCGDWRKGRRPSFIKAAAPAAGEQLYQYFIQCLTEDGVPVEAGIFGAMMKVHILNDGPVTFVLDSRLK